MLFLEAARLRQRCGQCRTDFLAPLTAVAGAATLLCPTCKRRSEQLAAQRRAANMRLAARIDAGEPCMACQSTHDLRPVYGQLILCGQCVTVAQGTCWRKRWYLTRQEAPTQQKDGTVLMPYRCRLCAHWHTSRRSEPAHPGQRERVAALSRALRAAGFHIDAARGWSNRPDGSHALDDE